jgi:hypothetical protein
MSRPGSALRLAIGMLTLSVALASGLDRAIAAPATTTPIKIGVLAPLTRPLAAPARGSTSLRSTARWRGARSS